MIWILLLCHFTADYPLQTDAMVVAKTQVLGLTAHVAIHLIIMLVVMVGILRMDLALVLPAILALTGFHFAIDTWKNILSRLRPNWVIFGYLQDQVLHIISIVLVAFWLESYVEKSAGVQESLRIIVPALGLVLATHGWFVTERVLAYKRSEYQQWVNTQSWPRMISRGIMLSAWFLGWNLWALLVFVVGLVHHWPDLKGPFHARGLVIDITVVLCIVLTLGVVR